MAVLTLKITSHGSNQRKGRAELKAEIPEEIADNLQLLVAWSNNFIQTVSTDLKHTNQWGCVICQQPSTEVKLASQSYLHQSSPSIVLHMFQLCRAGPTRCSMEVERIIADPRLMVSGVLSTPIQFPHAAGLNYSLSSSCAHCLRDDTARTDIHRCGKCRLVRYCSRDCQRGDWPRHRDVCDVIKSVSWEGPWC